MLLQAVVCGILAGMAFEAAVFDERILSTDTVRKHWRSNRAQFLWWAMFAALAYLAVVFVGSSAEMAAKPGVPWFFIGSFAIGLLLSAVVTKIK